MKYITRAPALFIAIVFSTTITAATTSTTAVAGASAPPPCPPQSASLPDPASTAAAINSATQALQATNITSQLAITSSKEVMEKNNAYYEGLAATNKAHYEKITTYLLWAAGGFAFFVSVGGITVLWALTQQRVNKMARKAVTEFRREFDDHLRTASTFHGETQQFRDETTGNLQGFIIFVPKYVELTTWASAHGNKSSRDPNRPNPHRIATSTLKACNEALSLNPTDKVLLTLIYSNQGVASHILGRYDAAYQAMLKSLEYDGDRPATLFNIACTACSLGRTDEAKQYLRHAILQEPERAEQAYGDSDFDRLRTDPEFLQLIGRSDGGNPNGGNPNGGNPNGGNPNGGNP